MIGHPVLFLSLDYAPNDGGISRLALGASEGLLRAGCEVSLVTLGAQTSHGLARPKIAVQEVSRRKGLRDWQIFRAVRRHLHRHGRGAPILASVWNPEATLALLAGARRISLMAHGNEVMRYAGPKAWLRRFVLNHAHQVICNSRFTQGLVLDIAPKARTRVLNPAVEAERFTCQTSRAAARQQLGLAQNAQIVLTVARLDPIKGHDTVLQAMAALSPAERAQLRYVIIGKGEQRGALEHMARALGLSDQVIFPGYVSEADLPLWYAAADLFVLCSILDPNRRGMEGFGMALTEAQAAGLPVIGTRSGGIPDAVAEGEGGWLIEERDSAALAQHLRHLTQDSAAFALQGGLGAQRVRREMSWGRYTSRLLALI